MKKSKNKRRYYSTIRGKPLIYRDYTNDGLKKLKRQLSLDILDNKDVSHLESDIRKYEARLNRIYDI